MAMPGGFTGMSPQCAGNFDPCFLPDDGVADRLCDASARLTTIDASCALASLFGRQAAWTVTGLAAVPLCKVRARSSPVAVKVRVPGDLTVVGGALPVAASARLPESGNASAADVLADHCAGTAIPPNVAITVSDSDALTMVAPSDLRYPAAACGSRSVSCMPDGWIGLPTVADAGTASATCVLTE
jgi:hypothetical protein